ncbi:unnamed protein product [Lota lota]
MSAAEISTDAGHGYTVPSSTAPRSPPQEREGTRRGQRLKHKDTQSLTTASAGESQRKNLLKPPLEEDWHRRVNARCT